MPFGCRKIILEERVEIQERIMSKEIDGIVL